MISGIYKITSPSGRVYIGQSVNINKRFYTYRKLECKRQPKLYNSLKKYGYDSHLFEVIEECDINNLNIRERYWQEFYNVISERGLNLQLVDCVGKKQMHSDETKKKISEKSKGRVFSKETRLKMSISAKNKIITEETRLKISIANSGKGNYWYGRKGELHPSFGKPGLRGELHPCFGKKGKENKNFGKKASLETRKKQSESSKRRRIVLCLQSGIFYYSNKEAAIAHGIPEARLSSYLLGTRTNKTSLIYV